MEVRSDFGQAIVGKKGAFEIPVIEGFWGSCFDLQEPLAIHPTSPICGSTPQDRP